ncbi:unnamed protein product [Pylaiella littoralis]
MMAQGFRNVMALVCLLAASASAFVMPIPAARASALAPRAVVSASTSALRPSARHSSRSALFMAEGVEEEAAEAVESAVDTAKDATTSVKSFFAPNENIRLGSSRDQDGKSNVWAVEPKMRVEQCFATVKAKYRPCNVFLEVSISNVVVFCRQPRVEQARSCGRNNRSAGGVDVGNHRIASRCRLPLTISNPVNKIDKYERKKKQLKLNMVFVALLVSTTAGQNRLRRVLYLFVGIYLRSRQSQLSRALLYASVV